MAGVVRVVRRERPESQRRPEASLHRVHDTPGPIPFENREGKSADGEDLVGPEARVEGPRGVVAVHDIVEEPSSLVPEPRGERPRGHLRHLVPAWREAAADAKSVDPERLDLNGLADARGNDPVADLR